SSEMSPTNVITATANIKKSTATSSISTLAIAAGANNDITLSFKQHPTSQKSSRIIPKHRWLCTKNGILKTNSNQVSTLSVRFNDNPPKLYLFNKSLQEQVPVLQVAGPSKGKYSRAELEEHREFMLTKIHIA
ncbi:631_t:CDS:2, partial [Entrophospora sp. SA101]